MSNKLKETLLYVAAFIAIFIVPNLLFHHFRSENDEMYYRWVAEDNETCRQRAKEDSRETVWCDEIRKAANLSYRQARSQNDSFILMMFQPLLFVLLISLYNLRKQVAELKEKIDV